MINTLIQRIFDARGKHKLEALLKQAKALGDKENLAIKTAGTNDELLKSDQAAVIEAVLTETEIARLVD